MDVNFCFNSYCYCNCRHSRELLTTRDIYSCISAMSANIPPHISGFLHSDIFAKCSNILLEWTFKFVIYDIGSLLFLPMLLWKSWSPTIIRYDSFLFSSISTKRKKAAHRYYCSVYTTELKGISGPSRMHYWICTRKLYSLPNGMLSPNCSLIQRLRKGQKTSKGASNSSVFYSHIF